MTWRIASGSVSDHVADVEDVAGNRGKFKQPRDQSAKKLIEISNELVCFQLARTAGVTTAYTCYAVVEGRPGIVSIVESSLNWNHIAANNLQTAVVNLDEFRGLLAFDLWTANTDHTTGRPDHVIVKQVGSNFLAYPIDAGHSLNGPTGDMWPDGHIEDLSKLPVESYSHISETEVQGYWQVEPMVVRIVSLNDDAIGNIVDNVSAQVTWNRPPDEVEHLTTNMEIVKRLLFFRKRSLVSWVRNWCRAKRKLAFAEPVREPT